MGRHPQWSRLGLTVGLKDPGVRGAGLPDHRWTRGWDPDEVDAKVRRVLEIRARGEDARTSYEAQVQLARRYRVRLMGHFRDGQYEPGPFDRLPPGWRKEVLALCNRPPLN